MASASLDWERHKEAMRALYVDENKTLRSVMEIMSRPPYNFSATKKQYERQFQKKWRFRKNLTKQDWRILHFKVTKRQSKGKGTKLLIDGRPQQMEKLEHEISRYGLHRSAAFDFEPKTPNGICLRSPTPTSPTPSSVTVGQIGQSERNPGITEYSLLPASIIGLTELDFFRTMSHMDGLPYFEVFKLFDMIIGGPQNQVVSMKFVDLATLIVLPDSPKWDGETFDKEVEASRRASLLKAIMPSGTYSLVNLTDTDRSENQLVQFLTNAAYLLYNDLGSPELDAIMAQFFSNPENNRIIEHLMSSSSIAIEAITEKLFLFLLQEGNDDSAAGLLEQGKVTPHPVHLTEAAPRGYLRTVELLLKAGVDPNARPTSSLRFQRYSGFTALEGAVMFDQTAIAKKLVEFGADPNLLKSKMSPEQCAFIYAIEKGHLELIKKFLHCPASQHINRLGPDDYALRLRFAAEEGDVKMVDALLPYVDVNHHTPNGYSVLVCAASRGRGNVVSLLLRSGASPNRYGSAREHNLGLSPLQAAISAIKHGYTRREDLDTVRLLIDYGADPNEPPPEGDFFLPWSTPFELIRHGTALEAAAEIEHEQLFTYLLNHGATTNQDWRESLASLASRKGLRDNLWASTPTPRSLDSTLEDHARTALIEAVQAQSFPVILGLLESGCDVNDTGTAHCGCTALTTAILTKEMAVVKLLLDAGADVNHPQASRDGGTALQAAIWIANMSLVQDLIALGADVFDDTALLIAVAEGSQDICTTLLSAIETKMTENPEQRIKGQLALRVAIESNNEPVVLRLVQLGINLNQLAVHDSDEETCKQCKLLERFGSDFWLSSRYYDSGPDREAALHTAIRLRRSQIVRRLLENNVDVELPVDTTRRDTTWPDAIPARLVTPLTSAAMLGLSDIVEILLDYGADINASAECSFGRTPLQAATEIGNFTIVQLLLDRGSDCNAPPARVGGATALQLASMKGYLSVARMLLDRGADPNAPAAEEQGRTALEGAAENGRLDILQLLLDSGAATGGPHSASFQRICHFAWQSGYMTVLKLLKSHMTRVRQTEQFHGGSMQDHSDAAEVFGICIVCGRVYEKDCGHICGDYDIDGSGGSDGNGNEASKEDDNSNYDGMDVEEVMEENWETDSTTYWEGIFQCPF